MLGVALAVGACSDDGDDGLAAYCDVAEEVAATGEGAPTTDQLQRLRDAAPDEIAGDVDAAASILEAHLDELEAGDSSVFEDPELQAPIGRVIAFDEDNCDFRG